MEINYKKLSISLGILLIISLILLSLNNPTVNSISYKELDKQNKYYLSKNKELSKSIDSLKVINKKAEILINNIETQKTIIKYEFIEKSKEIDNGSVSYIIDEYKIIFSKNNIR